MNYSAVFIDFITWWYSGGIKKLAKLEGAFLGSLNNFFSVSEVMQTFFSPWKRIMGQRREGIAGFWDALIDNTISRLIGVFVRTFLLITYLMVLSLYIILSALGWFLWLLWPLVFIGTLISLVV